MKEQWLLQGKLRSHDTDALIQSRLGATYYHSEVLATAKPTEVSLHITNQYINI